MKVNFKRMITVLAATAMCAVPMTSAMSASAGFDNAVKHEMVREVKSLDNSYVLADAISKGNEVGLFVVGTDLDDIPLSILSRANKGYRITSKGSRLVSFNNDRVGKFAPGTDLDDVPWWILIVASSDAKKLELDKYADRKGNKLVSLKGKVGLYTQDPPSGWIGAWPPEHIDPCAHVIGMKETQPRLSETVLSSSAYSRNTEVGLLAEPDGKDWGGLTPYINERVESVKVDKAFQMVR